MLLRSVRRAMANGRLVVLVAGLAWFAGCARGDRSPLLRRFRLDEI